LPYTGPSDRTTRSGLLAQGSAVILPSDELRDAIALVHVRRKVRTIDSVLY
jgi:hypothetical protein